MSDPSIPALRRAPAVDPAVQREIDILDMTRSEELQNEFLRRHEQELHSGPNAFFALTGRAAVGAASGAAAALRKARDELLEQVESPRQRQMLAEDLDAHLKVASDDIARHSARQANDWQRSVAQDRLDLLTRNAARDLTDMGRLKAYGAAAESAGRVFARAAGHAIDSPEADARAAAARSTLFRAALEAAFKTDPQRAMPSLNDTMRGWMSAEDAAELDALMKAPPQQPASATSPAGSQAPSPSHQDEPADPTSPPARGIAPDVEPPPGYPEHQGANDEFATSDQPSEPIMESAPARKATPALSSPPDSSLRGAARPQQAGVSTIPILGTGFGSSTVRGIAAGTGQTLKGMVRELKGVLPGALRLAARGGPAVGIMTTPMNTQAEVQSIGDDTRLVIPPGQAGVLQIRTNSGLLGTNISSDWKDVPVAISRSADADKKVIYTVDPVELANAVGTEKALRIATSSVLVPSIQPEDERPIAIEMRIGEKAAGDSTVRKREASDEEVARYCPSFPQLQQTGADVQRRVQSEGLIGAAAGTKVHNVMARLIKDELAKELERQGIYKMEVELALRNGAPKSYSRGYSRLDVLEVNRATGTVCIYDFKTGNGTFRDKTMDRYADEASKYLEGFFFWGDATQRALARNYTRIYLIPVHLP